MKCPQCQAEVAEDARYCSRCGHYLESEARRQAHSRNSVFSVERSPEGDDVAEGLLKPPSGFRRTLSTELVARQAELRTLIKLNAMIESRTYKPGEVIIHKGETNRNLFFLTEGLVEISKREEDGDLILNELGAPYILGDIAFLSGFPRTATAKARTEVRAFVLKYEDLRSLFRNFPEWLEPLLTSFATGIRSLQDKIEELERRVSELKKQGQTSAVD